MKSKLIIVSVLLVFFGCRKKELTKTYLVGHAYEAGTDKPLQGVNVKLVSLVSTGKGWLTGQKKTTIDETITNENGEYHFTFTPESETTQYILEGTKNLYYSFGQYSSAKTSLPTGGNQRVDFYLYAPCRVKIHAKNVQPFDQNDSFGMAGQCNGNIPIVGDKIDTTYIYQCYSLAGVNVDFYWWVKKNNIDKSFHQTFKALPFDTVLININY